MPPNGRGAGRGRGRGRGPGPDRRPRPRGPQPGARGAPDDDERAWQDLARFVSLAVEADPLEPFGLSADEAADLLLEVHAPGPPALDLVDALAPRVASLDLARASVDALARTRDAPGLDPDARRAVAAALRLARDCVDDGALPDHPLWEVLLSASLMRALTAGAVFERLLLPEGLDLERVAEAIARAAAQGGAREALRERGLAALADDPAAAAELVGDLAQDEEALPALGTDALLHVLRLRHEVLASEAEQLLVEGLPPARRAALEARLEAAVRADLQPDVADEVRAAALALLDRLPPSGGEGGAREQARAGLAGATEGGDTDGTSSREAGERSRTTPPTDDRAALAALLLALWAPGAPHEDQLLRGLLGQALRRPLLPEAEEPLAVAVWADPLDRGALEAYERHLRQAAPARADRVRRYLDALQ